MKAAEERKGQPKSQPPALRGHGRRIRESGLQICFKALRFKPGSMDFFELLEEEINEA